MNTDALATRLVDLEARKADLELEIKRIKAELLAAAEPGDTIAVGGIEAAERIQYAEALDAGYAKGFSEGYLAGHAVGYRLAVLRFANGGEA